jgi:hypothetical protein
MAARDKYEEHSGRRQGPAAGAVGFADRDAIAHRAYELFEERGREMGHDLDDWLRAEHESIEAKSRNQAE